MYRALVLANCWEFYVRSTAPYANGLIDKVDSSGCQFDIGKNFFWITPKNSMEVLMTVCVCVMAVRMS